MTNKLKTSLLVLLVTATNLGMFAQNTNPYKQFGYESKADYKLPMAELFRIINTDTTSEIKALAIDFEKAKGYLLGENDALIEEIAIDPQEILTWLTPDPKAHKYPHQSPYAYCSNNPIMKIDPDGMEDDWVLKDPPHNKEENYVRASSHYNTKNTQQKSTTDLSPKSIGMGASMDVTLAVGGIGVTAEIGIIKDSKGNASLFVSYGQAVGGEASIGVNALIIPQKTFDINNFEGQGISGNANLGLGTYINIGGFTDQSKGAVRDSYNNNYWGLKIGLGLGYGGSVSPNSKTSLKSPKNIPPVQVYWY